MKAALKSRQISRKGGGWGVGGGRRGKKKGNCTGICALSFLQAQSNVQPPGWEESADLRCHGGSREWRVVGGGIAQVDATVPRICPSAFSCHNQLGGQISERRLAAPPGGSSQDWHLQCGMEGKIHFKFTSSLIPPPRPTNA